MQIFRVETRNFGRKCPVRNAKLAAGEFERPPAAQLLQHAIDMYGANACSISQIGLDEGHKIVRLLAAIDCIKPVDEFAHKMGDAGDGARYWQPILPRLRP